VGAHLALAFILNRSLENHSEPMLTDIDMWVGHPVFPTKIANTPDAGAMETANKSIDQEARTIIQTILNRDGYHEPIIILFGSRARKTARKESDWDYLVIVSTPITPVQKRTLIQQIKRQMAKQSIPNYIIIQSRKEYEEKKRIPRTISRNISLEGLH
jgi:predicted nucleotidyltransferase